MRIDYHRTLIADTARNAAFYAALKAAVTPGLTTVADIGAGTGLLGLMAQKLGAKRVYMYETAEVGSVAERIIKANRITNCEIFAGHSTDIIDPPKVDLVVSETLGNYAFEEHMIETLNDARKRFLKPGGVMIPRAVTQTVCPVTSPRIHTELSVWDGVGHGIDMSVAKTMSFNNAYVRTLTPAELLPNAAKVWDTVEFAKDNKSNRKGDISWRLDNPATIYGFLNWWDATLSSTTTLTTSPSAPRTHWEQLYFPLLEPIKLAANETLALSLRTKTSHEGGTHMAWTATHQDATGKQRARQSLDLDKGYLP